MARYERAYTRPAISRARAPLKGPDAKNKQESRSYPKTPRATHASASRCFFSFFPPAAALALSRESSGPQPRHYARILNAEYYEILSRNLPPDRALPAPLPPPRFRSNTLLLLPGQILSHTQLARVVSALSVKLLSFHRRTAPQPAPGNSRTDRPRNLSRRLMRPCARAPAELLIKTSLLPPYLVPSRKCVFIPRAKAFRRMLDTPLA